MAHDNTRSISVDQIPVIDIGPLRDGSDRAGVAGQRVRAASEIGFIHVSNHGVAQRMLDDAREVGLAFFRMADDHELAAGTNGHHHGYLESGSTRNRVINSRGRERLSLVLACDPDFETMVDPAVCCSDRQSPCNPAISGGEHLLWRLGKTFSCRQT